MTTPPLLLAARSYMTTASYSWILQDYLHLLLDITWLPHLLPEITWLTPPTPEKHMTFSTVFTLRYCMTSSIHYRILQDYCHLPSVNQRKPKIFCGQYMTSSTYILHDFLHLLLDVTFMTSPYPLLYISWLPPSSPGYHMTFFHHLLLDTTWLPPTHSWILHDCLHLLLDITLLSPSSPGYYMTNFTYFWILQDSLTYSPIFRDYLHLLLDITWLPSIMYCLHLLLDIMWLSPFTPVDYIRKLPPPTHYWVLHDYFHLCTPGHPMTFFNYSWY
jgi:hypothetical protein